MRRILAILTSIAIILPALAKTEEQRVLVYGRIARLESGETYIFPDLIHGAGYLLPNRSNPEISGLRVAIPSRFENGDDFVGIGRLDFSEGCFEPDWHQMGDISWESGILEGDTLKTPAGRLKVSTKMTRFLKDGLYASGQALDQAEAECFGSMKGDTFEALAIAETDFGMARFCGIITGVQESGIVDFEAKRVYGPRSSETMKVLAQTNRLTRFQNGAGPATFKTLGFARLGACEGFYNPQSRIMQARTVVADINSAVFGGRLLGIVTSVGVDNMVIQTMLPGCIATSVKCKTDFAFVVKDGQDVKGSPRDWAVPEQTVVEVFGGFENDQFSFNTKLVRINPFEASRYFCGFHLDGGVLDIFGGKTKLSRSRSTKALSGKDDLRNGTFLVGWNERGKAVALFFPEIGLLGFRVAGTLKENRKGSFLLTLHDGFDRRLPGREYEVFFASHSKMVDPKRGFINPASVELSSRISCWGQVDENFSFVVTLADLE